MYDTNDMLNKGLNGGAKTTKTTTTKNTSSKNTSSKNTSSKKPLDDGTSNNNII